MIDEDVVVLAKAQADYVEFPRAVKRTMADAEKACHSGTKHAYIVEVAQLDKKRQRLQAKQQIDERVRQQTIGDERFVFVPTVVRSASFPGIYVRKPLHEAKVILVDDIAHGRIPATGKMHVLTLWAALTGKRLAELARLTASCGQKLDHGTLKFNYPLTNMLGILFTLHFKSQNPKLYGELQRWLVPPSRWIELDEMVYCHWMSTDRLRSRCTQINEVIGLHDLVREKASVDVKMKCSAKF